MDIPYARLNWDKTSKTHVPIPKRPVTERFLKGPVPLWWLQKAGVLGRAPVVVGLVLWFQYGLTGRNPVKLSNVALQPWEISRYAKYRALRRLEDAGLVNVERKGSQSPDIELVTKRK